MVELRNGKKVLITPLTKADLADIQAGDIVYLDGDLMTCRDVAHRRVMEYGRELPYDIRGKAILHAGPIVRPTSDGGYEMVSVGPTTSMRMEKFEYDFTQRTGVRVIVGKGGHGSQHGACLQGVRSHPLRIPGRLRRGGRHGGPENSGASLGRVGNAGDLMGLQGPGIGRSSSPSTPTAGTSLRSRRSSTTPGRKPPKQPFIRRFPS